MLIMSADQRRFERKSLSVQFHARDAQGVGQLFFDQRRPVDGAARS
jgi:hypothetical protein